MKLFLSILFSLIITSGLLAQNIGTDRPDQGDSPYTVGKSTVQIETGFALENSSVLTTDLQNLVVNNSLLRIGLSNSFEARVGLGYNIFQAKGANDDRFKEVLSGLTPIYLGFKTNILNEDDDNVGFGIIGYGTIGNSGSDDYKLDKTIPGLRLAFSKSINNYVGLGVNLGAEFGSETTSHIYNLALSVNPNAGRVSLYGELYGTITEGSLPDHRADAGILYLVNSDFQVDISAGLSLSEYNSYQNFWALGLSYRFN